MPHHPLIAAIPNSVKIFFSQDVVAPAGVLITGFGAISNSCGGIPTLGAAEPLKPP